LRKEDLTKIIKKVMRGDRDALTRLYESNIKTILFHVQALLDCPQDVEDVAQEVALEMLKGIGKLKSPYAFSAWLYRIILGACYRHNKKYIVNAPPENIEEFAGSIVDERNATPEQNYEQSELEREVMQMVNGLPDKQRLAVYMYYYDGLSYKEISKALGVTINTVGTNIAKAKKALKGMLDEHAGEEENNMKDLSKMAIAGILGRNIDQTCLGMSNTELISDIPVAVKDAIEQSAVALKQAHLAHLALMRNCIVGLVGVAVVAPAALHFFSPAEQSPPAASPPAIVEYETYLPDATITPTNEAGSVSYINPIAVRLEIGNGAPVGWEVKHADGAILLSGEGPAIGEELKTLSPGEYAIEWIVQENGTAQKAKIVKQIIIE
jgi:RNA polymerase sigma-70 factor (ECF subfamily)